MPTTPLVPLDRLPLAAPLALALLLGAGCAAPAGGAGPSDEPVEADLGGSALVVHFGGLDSLLSDPRDAGLRGALALVDERLLELADELERPVPPGAIELLCAALTAPWTLRVGLDGEDPVPVRATWVVRPGSAERAGALAAPLAGLLALFGFPHASVSDRPGLIQVEMPAGTLFHGTIEDGQAFLVAWGEPDERPWEGAGELPEGAPASLALGLDLSAILSTVRRHLPEGDEEADEVRRMLAFTGLDGDAQVTITFASGRGKERVHSVLRYGGWAALAAASGALAEGPIAPETFERVPDDALLVSFSRTEPTMLLRTLEMLSAQGHDARAELEAALGIALGPDLLEPLGSTFGFYLSDTTGGGGLASAVLCAAVDDEAVLAQTLETLSAQLHDFALSGAEGRMRVRAFEHDTTRGYQLDFPGLPVPFSPSLALAGGHLFVALTPAALAAALDAAREPERTRSGWLEQVARARLGSLDDLQSLFYYDAERFARQGYGMALGSAASLANALRSPTDPSRDPPEVLPPIDELLAEARPTVSLARVVDGDLVARGSSDGSVVLQLTSVLGWAPSAILAVSTLVALVTPMVNDLTHEASGAQESWQRTQAKLDIWQLVGAIEGHAEEHQGVYPERLEELLEPDEEGLSWLAEVPLDPWGNAYVYERTEDDYRVVCHGSDGAPGGVDEACDLSSDQLDESWGESEGDWEDEEGEWELEEGVWELEEPGEDEEEPEEDEG